MNRFPRFLPVFAVLLALAACHENEIITNLNVDSEQKISETEGNFNGSLAEGAQFGSAVAVIGDLEADGVVDLVVGAPFDRDRLRDILGGDPPDDPTDNRGAVWVLFMNTDGTVDLETKISDSEGNFGGRLEDGDRFGSAVAGIGDLNGDGFLDIAVGAPLDDDHRILSDTSDDSAGNNRGAVWILFLNADGTVQAEQKISDTAGNFTGRLNDNDQFGSSIAVLGDMDGDGITDLAVGAPFDDDDDTDTGAVWILFMNSDGTVKSEQKITINDSLLDRLVNINHQFGRSLANLGDLDSDGVVDIAVGAPGDNDDGQNRGAIWILFMNTDGTVASDTKISALETDIELTLDDGDSFGEAVANAGDLDGDNVIDLAVGAPFDDDAGTDRGAIWILLMQRDGEVHDIHKISNEQGILKAVLGDNDRFGAAITGAGNLDQQRANDLIIGAPLDDDGGTDKGAAWVLFMDDFETTTECERFSLFRFLNIADCN